MIENVTAGDFRDRFRDMGRDGAWSYDGLGVLFEHLESIEVDTGEQITLDVIAIDSEWCEYPSLAEFCTDYGCEDCETRDDITSVSWAIPVGDEGLIVSSY